MKMLENFSCMLRVKEIPINPLCTIDSAMPTLTNDKDPDKRLHFIRVHSVCLHKNNLQRKKYSFIWKL